MIATKINFCLATAAIASPAWLELLGQVSPALALFLQLLGIALALLQIVKLIRDWNKPK
ncbi:MAG: hypothetical protein AB7F74_15220 [Parvibaculaceae bacterium]